MRCPKCAFDDTKVLESRMATEGRSIRRRRCCIQCNYRFTTYEKEEDLPMQVQKKDLTFQRFQREKIANAISAACIKRPVSPADIEAVVEKIERRVLEEGDRIVLSKRIGDLTMDHLKNLDHVAYVRFASIYKDFKDPDQFLSELAELRKRV